VIKEFFWVLVLLGYICDAAAAPLTYKHAIKGMTSNFLSMYTSLPLILINR
jgi:hypothetical protein